MGPEFFGAANPTQLGHKSLPRQSLTVLGLQGPALDFSSRLMRQRVPRPRTLVCWRLLAHWLAYL